MTTSAAADETAPSFEPTSAQAVPNLSPFAGLGTDPGPSSLAGLSPDPGAEQLWTRGAATYPPTGAFPGGYPGTPQFGQPPSFDAPGYSYGYPGAPAWPPHLEGPKAWPVAVFTVFFGIFGAISAARRYSDARALGVAGGRYWGVFAGALVGSFAVWTFVLGLLIALSLPAYLQETTTVMTAAELEQELEASKDAGTVTEASCAEEAVDPNGTGTYHCMVSFSEGDALPYRITVSGDGSWAATEAD